MVTDGKERTAVGRPDLERDRSAGMGQRVLEQVVEDLIDVRGVGVGDRRVARGLDRASFPRCAFSPSLECPLRSRSQVGSR